MKSVFLFILTLHPWLGHGQHRFITRLPAQEVQRCLDISETETPTPEVYFCHRGTTQSFELTEGDAANQRLYLRKNFAGYLKINSQFEIEYDFQRKNTADYLFFDIACQTISLEKREGIWDLQFSNLQTEKVTTKWSPRSPDSCNPTRSIFTTETFTDDQEADIGKEIATLLSLINGTLKWSETQQAGDFIYKNDLLAIRKTIFQSKTYPGIYKIKELVDKVIGYQPVTTVSQGLQCLDANEPIEGGTVHLSRCHERLSQLWTLRADGKLQAYKTSYCLSHVYVARGLQLNDCKVAPKALISGNKYGMVVGGEILWLTVAADNELRLDLPFLNESLQAWNTNILDKKTTKIISQNEAHATTWNQFKSTIKFLRTIFQDNGSYSHLSANIRQDLQISEAFLKAGSFANSSFPQNLKFHMDRRRLARYKGKLRKRNSGRCIGTKTRGFGLDYLDCKQGGDHWTLKLFETPSSLGTIKNTRGRCLNGSSRKCLPNSFDPKNWDLVNPSIIWSQTMEGIGSRTGGRPFDDLDNTFFRASDKITKLYFAHKKERDYLHWFGYEFQSEKFVHGRGGSTNEQNIQLEADEFLVALEVCTGTRFRNRWRVFGLRPITLQKGVVKKGKIFGKTTEHCNGKIIAHPKDRPEENLFKHQIIGFFGRQGRDLDQLGGHFMSLPRMQSIE